MRPRRTCRGDRDRGRPPVVSRRLRGSPDPAAPGIPGPLWSGLKADRISLLEFIGLSASGAQSPLDAPHFPFALNSVDLIFVEKRRLSREASSPPRPACHHPAELS